MKKNGRPKVNYGGTLKGYLQWAWYMMILLAVMNVLVYMTDTTAGMIVSVFIVICGLGAWAIHRYYKPRILKEMTSFAAQYAQVQKSILQEFVIPYAILDVDGNMLWMNEAFGKVVGKDASYRRNIVALIPHINRNVLPKKDEEKEVEIQIGEADFAARMQWISMETMMEDIQIVDIPRGKNAMIAVYLFDKTEIHRYIRENQEQRLVAGLIYIDNYDEALESIDEGRRSLMAALIERKINKYMTNMDGIVKKLEKDKYFVIFQQKRLHELEQNRFSLLEEVKTVNIGNEMKVTLSIGIGLNGNSYLQNYEFARVAIELALGRGGDQAVIKENDQISYYGGKSQQVEKSTRVKARVKAQALREFIGSKENVVVMGHKNTDIDSFGASVGIYRAAKLMDKKAHIVLGDITASIRPWVNMFINNKDYDEDMFVNHEEAMELVSENSVVVVVDTNRPKMTECEQLLRQTKTIVVLDHHRQSSDVIQNAVLSYIEPYASSACEMVAEVLQYFADGIKLKATEADCIYAGMIIDTNNFVTKTGVRTFEAAAFLRRCGADVTRVRKMFRNDMQSYKARAEAVRMAEVFENAYAISICPSENLESPTIVGAQAANELLNIIGIKASFVITEYNNRIYISARAIDEVNVQIIMERLGGGGHMNIAGAQLDGVTSEEAKEEIKRVISEMIKEGAI
ncbi:MAG: DHH family phosphoesterase [Lachnospiraceae bacterium]|nr:DHH family phosphoesterase [Robinsoniella sp.]MDY3765591.1 DHH family phosphoesterase [Lachnospiraceae bacterium]